MIWPEEKERYTLKFYPKIKIEVSFSTHSEKPNEAELFITKNIPWS
jgi:hypothetical protein